MPDAAVLDAPPTQQQPPAPTTDEGPDLSSRMTSFAEKNPVSRAVEVPPAKTVEKPAEKAIAKPEEKPADKPAEKPAEKPVEKTPENPTEKPTEKPADAKAESSKAPRPWEMFRGEKAKREAVEAERDALKKEVETLRASKPEFDVTKHPEFVKHKTRAEELENEIRFVNYEKSLEFKEKYDTPYKEAWAQNAARAQQFTVKVKQMVDEGTGQMVEKDAGTRAVTDKEFWAIVTADDNTAIELADKLFPDSPSKSTRIQQLAEEVRSKGQSLQKALTEARAKGAEREKEMLTKKQQQEQLTRKQQEERAEKWSQIAESDRLDPRVKDLFNAADDDAKGKELLTKGQKAARLAFGLLEDGDKPLEGDAEIAAHAEVFNKAAAFNYNVFKRRQAEALVEELTKKLAEYEKSEPGSGNPPGSNTPTAEDADARMMKFASNG